MRISKWVLQENKLRQILRKMNISYSLICTRENTGQWKSVFLYIFCACATYITAWNCVSTKFSHQESRWKCCILYIYGYWKSLAYLRLEWCCSEKHQVFRIVVFAFIRAGTWYIHPLEYIKNLHQKYIKNCRINFFGQRIQQWLEAVQNWLHRWMIDGSSMPYWPIYHPGLSRAIFMPVE